MHTKRIARGARWLDQVKPGWENQVEIGLLDPLSNKDCVMGQVYGDFAEAMADMYPLTARFSCLPKPLAIPLAGPGYLRIAIWTIRRGFMTLKESDAQWRRAWVSEIKARRRNSQQRSLKSNYWMLQQEQRELANR